MKPKGYTSFAVAFLLVLSLAFAVSCINDLQEDENSRDFNVNTKSSTNVHTRPQIHTHKVIFDGGTDGYHTYRIPSIVKTTNGTLLAFAEGRRWNNKDYGDINLVYKRSTNNGDTWSSLMEVVGSGNGTWGNPTAVVDWNTGRVWLFMSWNDGYHSQYGGDGFEPIDSWGDRRVFLSYSDDHGLSWSTPQDLTNTLLPPGYTWDAMGPGIGIQKKFGPNQGRLVIPAHKRNIYSDDAGATWHYEAIPAGTGEGTLVELMDGRLMRNDRPGTTLWNQAKRRKISTGNIGSGFSPWTSDYTLLDPKCEASILRYNTDTPHRIIFLNPASTERRCKMRVRISYDDGNTWPMSRKTHDWLSDTETCNQGKGGYSSMTKTADYCIGALIEINEDVSNNSTSHRSIEFHKFNLSWIVDGTPEP